MDGQIWEQTEQIVLRNLYRQIQIKIDIGYIQIQIIDDIGMYINNYVYVYNNIYREKWLWRDTYMHVTIKDKRGCQFERNQGTVDGRVWKKE